MTSLLRNKTLENSKFHHELKSKRETNAVVENEKKRGLPPTAM